jgi:hypothetical protein
MAEPFLHLGYVGLVVDALVEAVARRACAPISKASNAEWARASR